MKYTLITGGLALGWFALMILVLPANTAHYAVPPAEGLKGQIEGIITAYTSRPEETDDSPFITASGARVRAGIAANNCLPFGTILIINGQQFEVQDRMNRRYGCNHFDLWMDSYEEAIAWGKLILPVKVFPDSSTSYPQ